TTCASTRSSLCAKPHDQHHGCPILQNLTHTTPIPNTLQVSANVASMAICFGLAVWLVRETALFDASRLKRDIPYGSLR
ncbi:hypothetical protein, partial [Mesorhizobium sp. M0036]|uniref:hypothetical protein n=1 Tax=Mesorhizobium sp. M0036 TaxID=2956853 RepID=UPI003338FB46